MPVPPVIQMYRYVMGSGGGLGNLLKASEEFQQTVDWVRYPTNSETPTVNADSRPDPNGGTTADQVDYTANTSARLQQTITLSASTQYTFSVYARAVSGTVDFRMRNVTLKDSEVKTATTTGPDGGGFTRFTYTFTTTTAGSYELALQNDTNATAKDVIFWGAMLNQGGTALDYEYAAPTTGGSAPAPAYAGFGDAFGGVTAYYSLRQFTEAETLNAIRVRRSSDDTEQDIGFDSNGDLDSTALLAFVGTGGTDNGYVTTFYDQSGNGNNATNSTESEQPLVVSGGSVITENGKAALDFDGVDDYVKASISITDYPVTNAIVQANDPTNSGYAWSLNNDTQSTQYYSNSDYSSSSIAFHTIRNSASVFFSQSWTDDDQNLLFAYSKANNDHAFGVNGGGLNTSTNSTTFPSVNNIAIGRLRFIGGPLSYLGKIQELIIFTSDQSSNRTGIETNINDHFSIYP